MLLILALWGAMGAFVYAANRLVMKLWNDGATAQTRSRAVAEFIIALVTGACFSASGAEALQLLLTHGVIVGTSSFKAHVNLSTIAFSIGWSSNYLWPKVLKWMGDVVERGGQVRSR